jgi:hypothetical protein
LLIYVVARLACWAVPAARASVAEKVDAHRDEQGQHGDAFLMLKSQFTLYRIVTQHREKLR